MTSQWFPPGQWYDAAEVADMLGVQVQTVYRWIKAGKLQAVHLPPPFDERRVRISAVVVSNMLTPDRSEV